VRDSGDSGVVMIAAAAEDGGGKQRWQRQLITAADNNNMQDWAADHERDGQERVARDDGDMEWQ
jgi:hypothetical protein